MLCIIVDLCPKWATVLEGKLIGTSKHKDYSIFHWKAHDVKTLKVAITKFVLVDARGEVDEVILADALKERGQNYKTAKRDDAELTDVELAEVMAAFELARAHLKANPVPTVTKPPVEAPAAERPTIFLSPEAVALGLTAAEQDRRDEEARFEQLYDSLHEELDAAEFDLDKAVTADELIAAVDKMHVAAIASLAVDMCAYGCTPEGLAKVEAAGGDAGADADNADAVPTEKSNPEVNAVPEGGPEAELDVEPEVEPDAQPEDPLATIKPSRKKKRR